MGIQLHVLTEESEETWHVDAQHNGWAVTTLYKFQHLWLMLLNSLIKNNLPQKPPLYSGDILEAYILHTMQYCS
jgi:hypothetical protein